MTAEDRTWIRRPPSSELDRRLELWHVLDRVATAASRVHGAVAICGTFVGVDPDEVGGWATPVGRTCPACVGQVVPVPAPEPPEMPGPPLLEQAMREGKSPADYLRQRTMLGFHLWLVPLRLLPYRGAARMMIGQLVAYEPDDLCDLPVATVDGEPSWVFASTREPGKGPLWALAYGPERPVAAVVAAVDVDEPGDRA